MAMWERGAEEVGDACDQDEDFVMEERELAAPFAAAAFRSWQECLRHLPALVKGEAVVFGLSTRQDGKTMKELKLSVLE